MLKISSHLIQRLFKLDSRTSTASASAFPQSRLELQTLEGRETPSNLTQLLDSTAVIGTDSALVQNNPQTETEISNQSMAVPVTSVQASGSGLEEFFSFQQAAGDDQSGVFVAPSDQNNSGSIDTVIQPSDQPNTDLLEQQKIQIPDPPILGKTSPGESKPRTLPGESKPGPILINPDGTFYPRDQLPPGKNKPIGSGTPIPIIIGVVDPEDRPKTIRLPADIVVPVYAKPPGVPPGTNKPIHGDIDTGNAKP